MPRSSILLSWNSTTLNLLWRSLRLSLHILHLPGVHLLPTGLAFLAHLQSSLFGFGLSVWTHWWCTWILLHLGVFLFIIIRSLFILFISDVGTRLFLQEVGVIIFAFRACGVLLCQILNGEVLWNLLHFHWTLVHHLVYLILSGSIVIFRRESCECSTCNRLIILLWRCTSSLLIRRLEFRFWLKLFEFFCSEWIGLLLLSELLLEFFLLLFALLLDPFGFILLSLGLLSCNFLLLLLRCFWVYGSTTRWVVWLINLILLCRTIVLRARGFIVDKVISYRQLVHRWIILRCTSWSDWLLKWVWVLTHGTRHHLLVSRMSHWHASLHHRSSNTSLIHDVSWLTHHLVSWWSQMHLVRITHGDLAHLLWVLTHHVWRHSRHSIIVSHVLHAWLHAHVGSLHHLLVIWVHTAWWPTILISWLIIRSHVCSHLLWMSPMLHWHPIHARLHSAWVWTLRHSSHHIWRHSLIHWNVAWNHIVIHSLAWSWRWAYATHPHILLPYTAVCIPLFVHIS